MAVSLLLFMLHNFAQIVNYGAWLISSYRRVKQGKDLAYRNIQQVRRFNNYRWALISIWALIIAIGWIYSLGFVNYLYVKVLMGIGFILLFATAIVIAVKYYKTDHSRNTNVVFACALGSMFAYVFMMYSLGCVIGGTIWGKPATQLIRTGNAFTTISHNPVPIVMEDFGIQGKGYRDSSADHDETIFANKRSYSDNYFASIGDKKTGIEYSVFTSSYPWVMNRYLQMLKSRNYTEYRDIDNAVWGANKAFHEDNNNRILIVYDKKLMQFKADIAYSQEQISLIRKQLNLY
jgi:hypothetical protein